MSRSNAIQCAVIAVLAALAWRFLPQERAHVLFPAAGAVTGALAAAWLGRHQRRRRD